MRRSLSSFATLVSLSFATLALACGGGGGNTGPGQDFSPTSNTTLTGSVSYQNVTIPSGVTVTLTGGTVLTVTGSATIAGTISGDCTSFEIRVTGSLTVNGLVRNTCTTAPAGSAPGIKLVADGGYTIGTTVSAQDAIVSDGPVRITDTATENSDFTPLPVGFGTVASPGGSDVRTPLEPQHAGAPAAVNRPVRAGKGESADITNDGPVTIAGLVQAKDGKDATPKTLAGTCDNSTAIGGTGGSVRVIARNSTLTVNANLQAGNGGTGGSCNAPSGCPSTAIGGMGGDGGSVLLGAQTIVFGAGVSLIRGNGGQGGDATAKGDDGPAACANGCPATATAGKGGGAGGIGYIHNVPGGITGSPSEGGADGGTGGFATATAGNGRDCNVCPAGKGGDGAVANATGGQGGNGATGFIFTMAAASHRKGNGGGASAVGGNGGKGSGCCDTQPGGSGGKGGNAISTSGQIGAVGIGGAGVRGNDTGNAGNGGKGGDGAGPGAGGAKGNGLGLPNPIPDGADGAPGAPCPISVTVTPPTQTIPQGGTGSVHVTISHTVTGTVTITVKDHLGNVRGSGTITAGSTSTDVFISVPGGFPTGTNTWTATASTAGLPDASGPFQVNVTAVTGTAVSGQWCGTNTSLLMFWYSDDGGVSWTQGTPTGQNFSHTFSGSKAGLAMDISTSGGTGREVRVYLFGSVELQTEMTQLCLTSTQGPNTVMATGRGIAATQHAYTTLGNSFTTFFGTNGADIPGQFNNVNTGTFDLFGVLQNSSNVPLKTYIWHNVMVPVTGNLLVDYGLGVAPDIRTYNIMNVGGDTPFYENFYWTPHMNAALVFNSSGQASGTAYNAAASQHSSGELFGAEAGASSSTDFRFVQQYNSTFTGGILTLPNPITFSTSCLGTGSPARFQVTGSTSLNQFFNVTASQGTRFVNIFESGTFNNGSTSYSIAMPLLTGLAPADGIQAGSTFTLSKTAESSNGVTVLGQPADGFILNGAQHSTTTSCP